MTSCSGYVAKQRQETSTAQKTLMQSGSLPFCKNRDFENSSVDADELQLFQPGVVTRVVTLVSHIDMPPRTLPHPVILVPFAICKKFNSCSP